MKPLAILLLCLLGFSASVYAEQEDFPPRFQAVMDYLLEVEYPELIDDKPYHIRPTGYDIGDLDNDGVDEVVVSFYPHYLQSPTIVIFRVDNKMNVTRLTEGLVPGPLVPVSGEYLDTHHTGHGVDLTTGDEGKKDPKKKQTFIEISLKHMGNVVAYRNFIHTDGRKGKGNYIDMQHIVNPPEDMTCQSFEFSRVERVEIGQKEGVSYPVIMALAGGEIYFYTIKGIRPNGLLEKSIEVVPLEDDIKSGGQTP
jgi:hypothetical protein